ncbi:MAG: hypothetical protein CMH53_05890 [Myxococcales bacterium]|nr:hypothetical protein [Myxococcales bacterium]
MLRHSPLAIVVILTVVGACTGAPEPPIQSVPVYDTFVAKDTGKAAKDSEVAGTEDSVSDTSDNQEVSDTTGGAADGSTTPCVPFGHKCVAQAIHDCTKDGQIGDKFKECSEDEVCIPQKSDADLRTCAPKVCEAGKASCQGKVAKTCNEWGSSFLFKDCKGFLCKDGKCSQTLKCEPNSKNCDGNKIMACNADGSAETNDTNCPDDTSCVDDVKTKSAECKAKICAPSQPACSGDLLSTCSGDGTFVVDGGIDCSQANQTCVVTGGFAKCIDPVCGDGKVNKAGEECDKGDQNGAPGVLCSAQCKQLDDSCLTVVDCKPLNLPPCSLGWACVAGGCVAQPAIAATCDDGDPCTEADLCVKGKCVGLPRSCDDDNPCTKDSCDSKASSPKIACVSESLSKVACDDGNPCTAGDECLLGACNPGSVVCECKKDSECSKFDDANPCTGVMVCKQGSCQIDLDKLPVCTDGVCRGKAKDAEACTKIKGVWLKTSSVCVIGSAANQGACQSAGHTWVDSGSCQVAQCEPTVGQCILKSIFDGTACTDGNACSSGDACVGGKCTGKPVKCEDSNACTNDSCDQKYGCKHVPNTAPCDDDNPCTGGDNCANGGCGGVGICECKSDKQCAKYGDPTNKCAGQWVCKQGQCSVDPKTIVSCDTSKDPACAVTQCDKIDGTCKSLDLPSGATCTDDSVCTDPGSCEKGVCEGIKTTLKCDDGNPCTIDTCDTKLGCVFKFGNEPCDDGNPCSKDDACKGGKCAPGKDICACVNDSECAGLATGNKCIGGYSCVTAAGQCMWDPAKKVTCGIGVCSNSSFINAEDCAKGKATWTADNVCASTACEPATGQCKQVKKIDGLACTDGSPCTLGDKCADGVCTGVANSCNDNNPCTSDACDPKLLGGCGFAVAPLDKKGCEDGDLCTEASVCQKGKCVGATQKKCVDDNPCTKDACQSGKGCVFPASKDPCDDGDACTLGDLCDGVKGLCLPGGITTTCNDGNLCTDDSCDKIKGCVKLPNKVTCDEGDPCTLVGTCTEGSCVSPGFKECNDDNPCTADSCDGKATKDGCVFTGAEGKCDDGDACTEKDTCIAATSTCYGQAVSCDDENVCTADSCDAKSGCIYNKAQGTCGPFAKCLDSKKGQPTCVITGDKKLLISEVYIGDPCNSIDDFVELHSSLAQQVDLTGYELQFRDVNSEAKDEWVTIFKFSKGTTITAGGYLLLATQGAKLPGGMKPDFESPQFKLLREGLQIRVYDRPHTLVHDTLAWGYGAKGGEGKTLMPWPSQRSIERRASSKSTSKSLQPWGTEWLQGNDVDTGDNQADFVERQVPEPQNSAVFEPACSGTCTGGKFCNYAGTNISKCVEDPTCAQGCGPGQKCSKIISACVIDSANKVVLSEVLVGGFNDPKAEFIELYNSGTQPADISGLQVFVKKSGATAGSSWGDAVAQVPGGSVVPAKHYYLVATSGWAKQHGHIDLVAKDLKLENTGGSIRLLDPRTDVEIDRFGWGQSNNASGSALAVQQIPAGFPMARKANSNSNGLTMALGGKEELAGNAYDSDNDANDWLILLSTTPHSLGSGEYAPACGGGCVTGLVCNWVIGADKCVDPSCAGQCTGGAICNVKTGKCDLRIIISQFDALGPDFKGGDKANNEFIELYNPGYVMADIGGLVLRYLSPVFGVKNVSPIFPTGKCVTNANSLCGSNDTKCRCQGEGTKACTSNLNCIKQTIAPHGYLLVLPQPYDQALPKPDLQNKNLMAMVPASGSLQLIRTDGSKFPNGNNIADQVCWGNMTKFGCVAQKNLPSFDNLDPACAYARKPIACSTGQTVGDPGHAHHYQGNGQWSGLNEGKDWVLQCPRKARNSNHPMQKL